MDLNPFAPFFREGFKIQAPKFFAIRFTEVVCGGEVVRAAALMAARSMPRGRDRQVHAPDLGQGRWLPGACRAAETTRYTRRVALFYRLTRLGCAKISDFRVKTDAGGI